jgi:hypothetical protein
MGTCLALLLNCPADDDLLGRLRSIEADIARRDKPRRLGSTATVITVPTAREPSVPAEVGVRPMIASGAGTISPAVPRRDAVVETAQWHVHTAQGQRHGPMSKDDVDRWAANGRLDASCQVWCEGWPQWKWAGEVYPQLATNLPAASGGDDNPFAFLDNERETITSRAKRGTYRHIPGLTGPGTLVSSYSQTAMRPANRRQGSELGNVLGKCVAFILCIPLGVGAAVALWMSAFPDAGGAMPVGFAVFGCYIAYSTLKALFGVQDT